MPAPPEILHWCGECRGERVHRLARLLNAGAVALYGCSCGRPPSMSKVNKTYQLSVTPSPVLWLSRDQFRAFNASWPGTVQELVARGAIGVHGEGVLLAADVGRLG